MTAVVRNSLLCSVAVFLAKARTTDAISNSCITCSGYVVSQYGLEGDWASMHDSRFFGRVGHSYSVEPHRFKQANCDIVACSVDLNAPKVAFFASMLHSLFLILPGGLNLVLTN